MCDGQRNSSISCSVTGEQIHGRPIQTSGSCLLRLQVGNYIACNVHTRSQDILHSSITVAVVHRPLDGSILQFITKLSDVLGQVIATNTDHLPLCDDMNCLTADPTSVNEDLTELLDVHSLCQ